MKIIIFDLYLDVRVAVGGGRFASGLAHFKNY